MVMQIIQESEDGSKTILFFGACSNIDTAKHNEFYAKFAVVGSKIFVKYYCTSIPII